MDDFVVNLKQIWTYPRKDTPSGNDLVLLQEGPGAGAYMSAFTSNLISFGLQGGGMINLALEGAGGIAFGPLNTMVFAGGHFAFSQPVTVGLLNADQVLIQGQNAASMADLIAFDHQVREDFGNIYAFRTVHSFNGRVGIVQLNEADILRGGGALAMNTKLFGFCIAPTPWDPRTCNDQIATTRFVHESVHDQLCRLLQTKPFVFSFNGRSGEIVLTTQDVNAAYFTDTPGIFARAPTPPFNDASTRIATTAFVDEALQEAKDTLIIQIDEVGQSVLDFLNEKYAPLDSPQFVGVPAGPTANPGTNTGQLATCAFVEAAVVASTTGVSTWNTRTGAVTLLQSDVTAVGGALLASPTFTGTPHAPTAAPGTNNTQLATTAFVAAALAGSVAGVSSFNTRTGAVVLTLADVTGTGILTDTALLGSPTAPTPPTADSDTSVATTAFVHAVVAALPAGGVTSFNTRTGAISLLGSDISAAGGALINSPTFTGIPAGPTAALGVSTTQLATTAFVQNAIGALNFAPIASPNFTGVPTGPTATAGTSNTQLATTAFVMAAVAAGTAGVASFNGRTGAVTLTGSDVTGTGVFTNSSLTGVPTAPTASPGTNTTQLATTAFVAAAITAGVANSVTSFNSRTGAVTLSAADISSATGALINSPTFTGSPKAPTPAGSSNDTSIATTAFVVAALAGGGGVSSFNGRAGAVTLTTADITGAGGAPINAPAFTGNATSGFAIPANDNTTSIATTAWVQAKLAAGGFLPLTGGTLTGDLSISKATPTLNLIRPAAGTTTGIVGYVGANQRWGMAFGNQSPETGSPANSGSDFVINRYSDAGAFIDSPFSIARSTGVTTHAGDVFIAKANPVLQMTKGASGQVMGINFALGSAMRWSISGGDNSPESGGGTNTGSNFSINAFGDAGSFFFCPFGVRRQDGMIALGATINGTYPFASGAAQVGMLNQAAVPTFKMQNTAAGVTTVPLYFFNSAGVSAGSITVTDTATAYNTASDARLKENDVPYDGGREVISQLAVKEFDWVATGESDIGLIAQEAYLVYPKAVTQGPGNDPWSIDYSKYVPILIEALQDAFAEIDEIKKTMFPTRSESTRVHTAPTPSSRHARGKPHR